MNGSWKNAAHWRLQLYAEMSAEIIDPIDESLDQ